MKKESKTSVNNRYIIQSCLNAEEVDVFILINSYQERQQIFKFRRFIQFQPVFKRDDSFVLSKAKLPMMFNDVHFI